MATKDEILTRLLKEENYVSGEELARQTGVSRAAVWKAIKSLKKSGYDIEGITKCGYKLKQNNSLVTAEGVKALLEKDIEVTHFDTVDSTNTYCKRLLADGKQGEFLVTAAKQTAGRGRQGKRGYIFLLLSAPILLFKMLSQPLPPLRLQCARQLKKLPI